MKKTIYIYVMFILLLTMACIKVKHDMVIEPITVTIEIRLKIEKELNDFFSDIDKVSEKDKKKPEKKSNSKEK